MSKRIVMAASFISRCSVISYCLLMSENPAMPFGLYLQEGVLREGSGADVTVWDPNAR